MRNSPQKLHEYSECIFWIWLIWILWGLIVVWTCQYRNKNFILDLFNFIEEKTPLLFLYKLFHPRPLAVQKEQILPDVFWMYISKTSLYYDTKALPWICKNPKVTNNGVPRIQKFSDKIMLDQRYWRMSKILWLQTVSIFTFFFFKSSRKQTWRGLCRKTTRAKARKVEDIVQEQMLLFFNF